MITLTIYLARFLGLRILAVLFALTSLLLLKDLIENVEDVLDRKGSIVALMEFVWYRLPTIVESVLPVSVLIGSVLGLRTLSTRSELVALWSAGISNAKLFALGLPLCCFIAISHHFVVGQLVPKYENALVEWWNPQGPKNKLLWLSGGENFVRIESMSANGTLLEDVTIFRTDSDDMAFSKTTAASAKHEKQGWLLNDVEIISGGLSLREVKQAAEQIWPGGPHPEILLTLFSEPAHLTNRQLRAIVSEQWSSSLEQPVYKTELARRAVVPLSSFLMLFLAVITVRGQNRGSGPQISAAISIAVGLSFLIADGFFKTMGRTGLFAAEVAAWSPLLIFFGAASLVLLQYER